MTGVEIEIPRPPNIDPCVFTGLLGVDEKIDEELLVVVVPPPKFKTTDFEEIDNTDVIETGLKDSVFDEKPDMAPENIDCIFVVCAAPTTSSMS